MKPANQRVVRNDVVSGGFVTRVTFSRSDFTPSHLLPCSLESAVKLYMSIRAAVT